LRCLPGAQAHIQRTIWSDLENIDVHVADASRIVTAAHFVALFLVILITPTRIGQWFNAFALKLRDMGVGGMFLLGFMVCELHISRSA